MCLCFALWLNFSIKKSDGKPLIQYDEILEGIRDFPHVGLNWFGNEK